MPKSAAISFDPNWSVFAAVARSVLIVAAEMGVPDRALLADAGIDPVWMSQPDNRLPVASFYRLYEAATKATDNPDLALAVGRVTYLAGLNLQLYMTTICKNLRDYLNLIPSVLQMRGDVGEVVIRGAGTEIRLDWVPLNPATGQDRFLTDEILSSSAAIVGSLCVLPIPVRRAEFTYQQPQDLSALIRVFGPDLAFAQDVSCLYFDRAALDYPIVQQDYEGQGATDTPYSNLFSVTNSAHDFLSSLRQSIIRRLPKGDITIDVIAGELNVSRRTLQRRLSAENTSFINELQEVRATQARRFLSDKRLSITEIAFLLGYGDQASFSHAFRTWYDMSPSDYRQQ